SFVAAFTRWKTAQSFQNLADDQARRALVRLDHDIGYLAVQRIANRHEIGQNLPGVGRLQQWPIAIAGSAIELLIDRGTQIDDAPAHLQYPAVLRPQHRTSSGRQNDTNQLTQIRDGMVLPLAKSLLALNVEYQRNAGTRSPLDLFVGVPERQP